MKHMLLGLTIACGTLSFSDLGGQTAEAGYRQYYSSWSYQPQRRYHVCRYYHKPTTSYSGYNYHYVVRYPRTYSSRPRYSRYVYYYNPVRRVYWGRFDLEGKPGEQYSLLAEKDQKTNLDDIPENAFPKPGPMPVVPDSDDNERMQLIDPTTLPDIGAEDLPPAPSDDKV